MKMNNNYTFEELINQLESTVKLLENGNVTLDESIDLYKTAMTLSFECKKILDNAKQKIEIINNDNHEGE